METIKSAFILSVLGECYEEKPKVFEDAKEKFKDKLVNFGFLPSKEDFYKVLESADIAVSTADHEFFGVSMVEAARFGCFPVAPNRLRFDYQTNLLVGGRRRLNPFFLAIRNYFQKDVFSTQNRSLVSFCEIWSLAAAKNSKSLMKI